jgi:hypothetical protein
MATSAWIAAPSLLLLLCAPLVKAQSGSPANYTFMVASGFLCEPGDSGSCPAVAKSANGDSYEISGAGTFDLTNKSVKAAGTFNHKATNGNVLETGVWIASELVSFNSYGVAPGAFMKKGPALGGPQISAKHSPMRSVALPTGGLAIFRVVLMPVTGATATAVLQVNCALGDVPRERSVEGIRITFERNNFEYSEEASGRVIFLAQRREGNTPSKVPEAEAQPEGSVEPQK